MITPELQAMIGRQVHYPAREAFGHASIRYFALAMHDDNPLYVDEAYAQAAGHDGVIAPPTLVCTTSPSFAVFLRSALLALPTKTNVACCSARLTPKTIPWRYATHAAQGWAHP